MGQNFPPQNESKPRGSNSKNERTLISFLCNILQILHISCNISLKYYVLRNFLEKNQTSNSIQNIKKNPVFTKIYGKERDFVFYFLYLRTIVTKYSKNITYFTKYFRKITNITKYCRIFQKYYKYYKILQILRNITKYYKILRFITNIMKYFRILRIIPEYYKYYEIPITNITKYYKY